MRQRGFTLAEVVVALLILTIVLTTSIAAFFERSRRVQLANETMAAYQALSNEAEVRRRIAYANLDTAGASFLSDTAVLTVLGPYKATVDVTLLKPQIKQVMMTITWRGGRRSARLPLLRTDTGGSNLW